MAFLILLASFLLALSSVLGTPTSEVRLSPGSWADTEQGLVVHNTGYQGDGLYSAVFDHAGVATVNFTALDNLNFTIPQAQPTADHEPVVDKRQILGTPSFQVTCDKGRCSNNEGDLQEAMGYLAYQMGNAHQEPQHWIWLWFKGFTAFVCVYFQGTVSDGWVYYYNTQINSFCGSTCYGYTRGYSTQEGVFDMSIGRTHQGDNFCAKKFNGY